MQVVCNRRQRNILRKVLGNIFGSIFDDPAALIRSHEQVVRKDLDVVLESIADVVDVL